MKTYRPEELGIVEKPKTCCEECWLRSELELLKANICQYFKYEALYASQYDRTLSIIDGIIDFVDNMDNKVETLIRYRYKK